MPTFFVKTITQHILAELNKLIMATEQSDKNYGLVRYTDVSERKLTKDEEVKANIEKYVKDFSLPQYQFKEGPLEGEPQPGEIYIWLKAPYELCVYEQGTPIQKNKIYIEIKNDSCFSYSLINTQNQAITKFFTKFELKLNDSEELSFENIKKHQEEFFSTLVERKETATTSQRVFYALHTEKGVISDYLDFQPEQKMQFFAGEYFLLQVEQRKELILRLIREKGYVPDPDKEAWTYLTNILSDAKTYSLMQDRSGKLSPKSHATCYEKLKNNMDFIRNDFLEANLHNFSPDDDRSTLYENHLRFAMAEYLSNAVLNPSTSIFGNVSPEKQKATTTALLKCETELMVLDRRLERYYECKKAIVTQCVKEIAEANIKICKANTYSISIFGLSTGPSVGKLQKGLKKVAIEVLGFATLESLIEPQPQISSSQLSA